MSQKKKSLVRRLVVTFLLLSLFGVTIMSLLVYTLTHSTIRTEVFERLHVASILKTSELDRWVLDQKNTFIALTRAPALRERAAVLLTRSVIHPYYAPAYLELAEVLASLVKNTPEFRELLIVDGVTGQVLLSTKPEHIGESRLDDTSARQGITKTYVAYVGPSSPDQEVAISIATPLLNEKGEKRGILIGYLEIERMLQIIQADTGLGATSATCVLDGNNILFSPGAMNTPVAPTEAQLAKEEGVISLPDDSGHPLVGYFKWLKEPRIAILTTIQEYEAFRPARQLGLVITAIGMCLTVLLCGGILIAARRIARPIVAIAEASSRVAAGDFSIQVPITTEDEIGILSTSFNTMVTQLQQFYQESLASGERFRTLFQLSPDAVAVQDLQHGTFIEVNRSFCELFRYPEDEVIGQSAQEIGIIASRQDHLRFTARLKKTGQVGNLKLKFRKQDGELFQGVIFSRIIDLQGVQAVISVLWDISEQQMTEAALMRSQAFLRSIIDHMDNGILTLDDQRRAVYYNDKYLELYPFDRSFMESKPSVEALIAKACDMGIYPRERCDSLIRERLRQIDQEDGIIAVQTPRTDGIILEGFATRLPGWGYLIFFRDVTARRQAEIALLQRERQFREIFRISPNPLLIERLDGGGIIDVNQAFVRLTGFSITDCQDADSFALGLWQAAEQRRDFFEALSRNGEIHDFECELLRKGGPPWVSLVSARVIFIQEQECAVIVCRDITQEKEIETALRDMDRLKSDFISIAAHELNTPLSIIMGYTEFLLKPDRFGQFSETQKLDFLTEIYEKCVALSRLIDELLDISRIESGTSIALAIELHEPAETLQKIVQRFQLHNPGYTFHLELVEPHPEFLAYDLLRFVQVMENFLTNAVKYSPTQSTIKITAKVTGEEYQVSVQDQGIGMTPEQAERIFEKFYRADTSNTAVSGLGLGMSIARQIVLLHGGRVWVESSPGTGTTVFFTLPLNPIGQA